MLRVGLTGGIGAGKSTVARRLAQAGATVVDADVIAREVVARGTEGLDRLVAEFGTAVLTPEGTLDRAALGATVFGDDGARLRLNSILHPLIGARTAELVAAVPADTVVVQDIPLLVEGGMASFFHLVVVVHAGEQERVDRLVGQRGMAEKDARARIKAQADEAQRRAAADVWLDNGGAPHALDSTVDALWTNRLEPFEHNVRLRMPVRSGDAVLVEPRADWAAQGRRLVGRLQVACGERALRVDHVGSTAVAGLAAKDVLDFQITVQSLEQAQALEQPLADAGFPPRPDIDHDSPKPGVAGPWLKRFHNGADPARPVNVHLRVQGRPGQQFALIFRDWLRANPTAAAEYEQFKRDAMSGARAVEDYAAAKEPWFDVAYPLTLDWARRTSWTAGD